MGVYSGPSPAPSSGASAGKRQAGRKYGSLARYHRIPRLRRSARGYGRNPLKSSQAAYFRRRGGRARSGVRQSGSLLAGGELNEESCLSCRRIRAFFCARVAFRTSFDRFPCLGSPRRLL